MSVISMIMISLPFSWMEKSFAQNEMIIALGVTLQGEKVILGMIESHTENHRVCREFLQNLKERGLRDENKLLFIIDGAKD